MKNTKKLLAIFLAFVLAFSMVGTCMAEENVLLIAPKSTAVEMETIDLAPLFENKDGWKITKSSADTYHDVTLSKDGFVSKENAMALAGIKDTDLNDRLIQFDFTASYKNEKGESVWPGITLRAASQDSTIWTAGGGGYLFVFTAERIEMQRWNGGKQEFLDIVPNTYIKQDETASISVGAIDVEGGTNIFLFIDGKCAMNVFDPAEKASVNKAGGLTFYLPYGTKVSKYTGGEIDPVPFNVNITGLPAVGEKLNVSYKIASFGKEKDLDVKLNWFFSETHLGTPSEVDLNAMKEFKTYQCVGTYPSLGITGNECEITEDRSKGFYLVKTEDENAGISIESNVYEANYDAYLQEQLQNHLDTEAIFLKLNCQYAVCGGEKFEIDPDDYHVIPTLVNDRTLVPVRFVAERLGAKVGWEDETQTVTIELGERVIKMVIDKDEYTVNGQVLKLDVPATTIYDRTMVPIRAISEAFDKAVYWDNDRELICIYGSDYKDDIDFAEYEDYLKKIATNIERAF